MSDLSFDRDGAERFPAAVDESGCLAIERALVDFPADLPGVRIGTSIALASILSPGSVVGMIAAIVLRPSARAVRAVLFDKTAVTNWSLGWHQDRTIVVEQRAEVDGFGPWTVKSGLIQVEPPFAILDRMVTVRIHLDPVHEANAPLRIVPGSHRLGRIPEIEIGPIVARLGERPCLAGRGDVWLYATPILHGSRAADIPCRRRVLQVDYSADDLPKPLRWRGI